VIPDNDRGQSAMRTVLSEMNELGGFSLSVLTDLQGFPIASAASADQAPDAQAAVVALVQKTAAQVRDRLGMAAADEITLFDSAGRRLVCRPFSVGDYGLILAVMIPDRRKRYRLLTNRAIRALHAELQSIWG
jgi:predicted regulator of Ras-like GTPase activity (Roadblock/LC7/MglB family)